MESSYEPKTGTTAFYFFDPCMDVGYGELLCEAMRADTARVQRAAYYHAAHSDKLTIEIQTVGPSVSATAVFRDACLARASQLDALLRSLNE